MKTIDKLASEIYSGAVLPADALAQLQANEVQVWAPEGDPETWGAVEDKAVGYSGIHHALAKAGAADMSDAFSAEIARLQTEGVVIPL